MNLDELQSVQARERQTDSLQQLRESFYEDAGEYIHELRDERDRAAERAADPFDSPEVNRLSDDIKTSEQTVEALYERRVGKVVKMASLAAADMPAEEEGLTREERDLFETLLHTIEENRERVLDVLAGEASPGAVSTAASSERAADASSEARDEAAGAGPDEQGQAAAGDDAGVDVADVMGGAGDGASEATPTEIPPDEPLDAPPAEESGQGASPPPSQSSDDGGADSSDVERRTVRITDDVGAIFGVDEREYELSTDDVVTLPAANADPLVERDAAEPLE